MGGSGTRGWEVEFPGAVYGVGELYFGEFLLIYFAPFLGRKMECEVRGLRDTDGE